MHIHGCNCLVDRRLSRRSESPSDMCSSLDVLLRPCLFSLWPRKNRSIKIDNEPGLYCKLQHMINLFDSLFLIKLAHPRSHFSISINMKPLFSQMRFEKTGSMKGATKFQDKVQRSKAEKAYERVQYYPDSHQKISDRGFDFTMNTQYLNYLRKQFWLTQTLLQ